MKKRILLLAFALFLLTFSVLEATAAEGSFSWYCKRQKAHRQPLCEPQFAFAEKYGAYFIDHAHADGDADKVVYLTFDAGYENGNVERILNTLAAREVPAAFFVLQHFVSANGDLVERMVADGHLVCNHTAHHKDLSFASEREIREEIEGLEREYRELTGLEMARFFRPPEGRFSEKLLKSVSNMGYTTVFWSFAYADWDNNKQPSEEKAMQCIMDNIHNGAILLLHPTSATNAAVLPRVIDTLRAEGYRFGRLEELCAAR